MSESVEEEKISWRVWCNDNSERLKLAGYVILGVSMTSLGGYFLYNRYSSDE